MVQGKDFTLGFTILKNVHSLFILLGKEIVNVKEKRKISRRIKKNEC